MQIFLTNLASVDLAWYCQLVTVTDPSAEGRAGLPERHVTMSQLVAYNMAFFRKAAGLDQKEFGRLVGWSAASVSAAERSWDSKRVKKFDADEITLIAAVLGLPLTAMFLPPEDHGTAVNYVIDMLAQDAGQLAYVFLPQIFPLLSPLDAATYPVVAAYQNRVIPLTSRESGPEDELWQAKADLASAKFAVHAAETRLAELTGDLGTTDGNANEEAQALDALTSAREELDSLIRTRERVKTQIGHAEGHLEYLRAFERHYRTKLQAFVEGQLHELYAPEMRQQAEDRIRELRQQADTGAVPLASALLLHGDGTYEVLPLDPGAGTENTDNEGLSDHDTEE
jgi:transcriptional regulator with XRE-family HTH domain